MKCVGIQNLTVCRMACSWRKKHKHTLKCRSTGHCQYGIKCSGGKDNVYTKKRAGRIAVLNGGYGL